MGKLLLGAMLAMAASTLHAATWSIGTATVWPGQTAQIPITLAGDGVTAAAEINLAFDETRLTLPVAGGEIPGANVAGMCEKHLEDGFRDRLRHRLDLAGRPANHLQRSFPRARQRKARPHRAAGELEGMRRYQRNPFLHRDGRLDPGTGQSAAAADPPAAEETDTLSVLLRASGPSVSELVDFDYGANAMHAPLPALREGVLRVRPSTTYAAAGDYLKRLQLAPDSAEAKAERYVYVDFRSRASRLHAQETFAHDGSVEAVDVVWITPFGPPPEPGGPTTSGTANAQSKAGAAGTQDFLDVLGLPSAWNRAGGWGLVGVLDNGINANHPQLRSFTGPGSVGGSYVPGGNYLPYFSRNVGGRQPVDNLEEIQPSTTLNPVDQQCDVLDGVDDDLLQYGIGGHGTHVAGLVAANGVDQQGVRGACVGCGIVAVKRTWLTCFLNNGQPEVRAATLGGVDADGLEHLYKSGVQVVNMSFSNEQTPCFEASNNRICNAIHTAFRNDIVMVAAAGNDRKPLRFPANDPRVASIGGLNESNGFWDESPGSFVDCPYKSDIECGSNVAPDTVLKRRQEVVATAKSVRSTFYSGKNWSSTLGCGDAFGEGSAWDGEGLCTGTSMSAPQLAGLYGLLRSINPLMRAGDPVDKTDSIYAMPDGIREIVAQTASRSVANLPESTQMGFGIPNADAAVRKVLGSVRNLPASNRVTPLFGMFSAGSNDYAAVATPQLAMARLLYSANAYRSVHAAGDSFVQGVSIPGYTAFPNPEAGFPRARAMILTTERKPVPLGANHPAPVPVVLLERKRQGPTPCEASSPLCHGDSVIGLQSQLQAAVDAGYANGGLQGYIFAKCTPQPACIPPGTQPLHIKCTAGVHADCANFLESDRSVFESMGYTSTFLGAASSVIGYAYPVADVDSDGLVDAMEYVVGASTNFADSDGDGASDGAEYPLGSAPISDPCSGPNVQCTLGQYFIYANGFEQ